MVSIIENWTSVRGEILSIDVQANDAIWEMTLKVLETKKHKEYPELVRVPESRELKVKLQAEAAEALSPEKGDVISGLVRAAGPKGYFFKPSSVKKL